MISEKEFLDEDKTVTEPTEEKCARKTNQIKHFVVNSQCTKKGWVNR